MKRDPSEEVLFPAPDKDLPTLNGIPLDFAGPIWHMTEREILEEMSDMAEEGYRTSLEDFWDDETKVE